MGKKKKFNMYKELSKLTDNRRDQGKRHKIEDIVMIVLLATMSGYQGYHAIDDFIKRYRKDLLKYLKPKKERLPSISTIRRVMGNIDFIELKSILEKWSKAKISLNQYEWISLDGKSINGTIPKSKHKTVNLISLFHHNKSQVLSVSKVDEKSNEIPKVQEMIKKFNQKKFVFIADALHCQTKTACVIADNNNFYVLQVKKNQKFLLRKVKFISSSTSVIDKHITNEKNRGRYETREVTLHNTYLDINFFWKDAKYVVHVKRTITKDNKTSIEDAYFITNLYAPAEVFNQGIRNHWHIENCLHYVKDVSLKEDYLRIRSGNAPENFSIIRSFVINVFRFNGFTKIIQTIRLFAGNIIALLDLLN